MVTIGGLGPLSLDERSFSKMTTVLTPFLVAFSREALKPPRKVMFSTGRSVPLLGATQAEVDFPCGTPEIQSTSHDKAVPDLDGKWYVRAGIPVTDLAIRRKQRNKNTQLKYTGVFFD